MTRAEAIDFHLIALRLLAAECFVFLDGTNKSYERWKPYRRWAASLRPERDRVVTFNYDLVPDALLGDMKAKILLPSEAIPGTDYRRVPFLKLHGSLDWRNNAGVIEQVAKTAVALTAKSTDEIALATPGPRKERAISAELQPLWIEAEEVVRSADSLVFIGYQIPPTDAYTRGWLVNLIRERAIEASKGQVSRQFFRLVLGPDLGGKEIKRLADLIHNAVRSESGVYALPLWAEDFLDVFDRDEL